VIEDSTMAIRGRSSWKRWENQQTTKNMSLKEHGLNCKGKQISNNKMVFFFFISKHGYIEKVQFVSNKLVPTHVILGW